MTDKQILNSAIEQANKNMSNGMKFTIGLANFISTELDCYHIIFDHNFAKAFWGTNTTNQLGTDVSYTDPLKALAIAAGCKDGIKPDGINLFEAWEYHIQKMVLKENKIQYLKQFLK